MFDRIKALFGRKKPAGVVAFPKATKPTPAIDRRRVIPAGVGFDTPDIDIEMPQRPVLRDMSTKRAEESPRHLETPSPAWQPTPSPVWEPPASPCSYGDDTPSYSDSGSCSYSDSGSCSSPCD